ncbi:MAG: hypothetical protein K5697_10155 [Lachnospiraceae bacterium]|nr:hypothetical protein [Lachnospiraceae bacterium]
MASSIIHLAITNELTKQLTFSDVARLKFGAVVVDAGVGGNQYSNTHLKINVQDGKKRTYDLDRYRELFGDRMLTDDLYMGYYLHLVQDSLYRHYVYDRYHWNPRIPGNVERLHKDYEMINQYVINKYGLKNDLIVPDSFEDEALNRISAFDTERLMRDMASYFSTVDEEPIFFFTKEMSDEFIEEAVGFCVEEVKKIRNGERGIDMLMYAWKRADV